MILSNVTFLHHLADLADAKIMPRYRIDISVHTRPKEGYTSASVT